MGTDDDITRNTASNDTAHDADAGAAANQAPPREEGVGVNEAPPEIAASIFAALGNVEAMRGVSMENVRVTATDADGNPVDPNSADAVSHQWKVTAPPPAPPRGGVVTTLFAVIFGVTAIMAREIPALILLLGILALFCASVGLHSPAGQRYGIVRAVARLGRLLGVLAVIGFFINLTS